MLSSLHLAFATLKREWGPPPPDLKCDELLNRKFVGDWKLPAKECLSPWGTSKARRIEPIRLTVSSMSCDLSVVMAYYDDKWTHLSNWSLSTHFSSFLESWGHYLSASDRQQWQPRRQGHTWLDTDDCFTLWIYLRRFPKKCTFLVRHVWISERIIMLTSFISKHPTLGAMLWEEGTGISVC